MLFAVSGSQGSGKSTTLNALEDLGYTVLKRKVSRSILSDWDVTLDEVNSDIDLSLKFQDEILERKFQDELDAVSSKDIYFTERTYLDSFVYYMYTFGSKTAFDQKITTYYNKCISYDSKYNGIFLLPSGKFPAQADGVRNTNKLYIESVDVVLKNFLVKNFNDKLFDVECVNVNERVNFIREICQRN